MEDQKQTYEQKAKEALQKMLEDKLQAEQQLQNSQVRNTFDTWLCISSSPFISGKGNNQFTVCKDAKLLFFFNATTHSPKVTTTCAHFMLFLIISHCSYLFLLEVPGCGKGGPCLLEGALHHAQI